MSRRTNNLHSSDRQKDMDDLIRGLPSRSGHRREAKRWGKFVLKILIILTILTGTVYGVHYLWKRFVVFNQNFKLEKIQFETNGHMTETEVRKILGLTGEENVLFVNTSALEEKLKARPDIVKASVSRETPATLIIELEERVPVAWLECPQDNLYGRDRENGKFLDSSGYIFSYDPELHKRYESCPVIRAAPPLDGHYGSGEWLEGTSARQGLSFLRTAKAFVNEGIPLVQSLDFVNDWSFIAHFPDGMAITFGLFDHERQLHDLALVMQHANATNRSVRTANMMPMRNMPVVFGNKRDVPIVRAEIVDEEVFSPASREKQGSGKPEEPAGAVKAEPDGARVAGGGKNAAEEKTEVRQAAPRESSSAGSRENSRDKDKGNTAAVRKNTATKEGTVRAAEVVDEDEPAPRKKASSTGKGASRSTADKSSAARNSSARKSSGETAKKSAGTAQKQAGQAQTQSRKSKTSSEGTKKPSSGSSRNNQPAPPPPAKKQVEVPTFNW